MPSLTCTFLIKQKCVLVQSVPTGPRLSGQDPGSHPPQPLHDGLKEAWNPRLTSLFHPDLLSSPFLYSPCPCICCLFVYLLRYFYKPSARPMAVYPNPAQSNKEPHTALVSASLFSSLCRSCSASWGSWTGCRNDRSFTLRGPKRMRTVYAVSGCRIV